MSYSQVIVVGNLGADPESRFTPGGQQVTNFSVAENRSYTKDGQRVSSTCWYRVSTWGRLAETCQEHLSKGRQVAVIGQLQHEDGNPRVYTKNDGTPGASFEIRADRVVFLSGGEQKPQQADGEDDDLLPF